MILSAPLPPQEGIGFYAWNLAKQLSSQGNQVQLITRGRAQHTTCELVDGIKLWRATFLPVYPFHVHLHNLFVNDLIQRLDAQVDLYHLHTPLVEVPETKKPLLVTVHTPMKADTGSIQAKNGLSWLVRLQLPFSVNLERQLFMRADKIVAVARSVASELEEYGIDPQRVVVLGNGVDTKVFQRRQAQVEISTAYFLTVGRLGLRKGLADLLNCAQIVTQQRPDVQFWVAGEGPLRNELDGLIRQLGLRERVRLLGHISSRAEMMSLYQGAMGFLHPAHYEGLPTVLLEAMACSCPVVATAVSGALDVVQDGENGLLVPPRQPQVMATAVLRLLQEPALRECLGRAARQTIEKHYSWEAVSQGYLAEYQRLVSGVQS